MTNNSSRFVRVLCAMTSNYPCGVGEPLPLLRFCLNELRSYYILVVQANHIWAEPYRASGFERLLAYTLCPDDRAYYIISIIKSGERTTGTWTNRRVRSGRATMTSIIVLSVWGTIAAACVIGSMKNNHWGGRTMLERIDLVALMLSGNLDEYVRAICNVGEQLLNH